MAGYLEIDLNDIEQYEMIGQGSFGDVYRGLWRSKNSCN